MSSESHRRAQVAVLIPARMAATRLPGKPLLDIAGLPMIVRVWERAVASGLGPVVVACAEASIRDAVEAAGGRAVLTDPALPSGTDRIRAALDEVDPDRRFELIVNVQGDLPTLPPAMIGRALAPIERLGCDLGTLAVPTDDPADRANPNIVKAVVSLSADQPGLGRALYFTRAAAPSGPGPLLHHIGLYAYRREALERLTRLPPSPLERRERLEQLRALEAGMSIGVAIVETVPLGVDTPADLALARAAFSKETRP